jgi:hypothetical protein
MANWREIEDKLADILSDNYYRETHNITSARQFARECVQRAQGNALPAYSGEITVVELKHPARLGFPTRLVRGFDTTRSHSPFGEWWIDYELFDRFRRATASMPSAVREQKIKAFMRARSAVSHDWSNMAGISELKLPAGSRTPALVGKAHYQAFITDPKHPAYVPNVFFMGGDLQFYVCVRERSWIQDFSAAAGAA